MYKYDVFVSYKRGGSRDEWMVDLFMPWFEEKLDEAFASQALDPPEIFFDRKQIQDGSDWEITIKQAIARSKFMVSICTPTYFRRSEWCMREFAAMYFRAKQLGFLSTANQAGLLRPVIKQKAEVVPKFFQVLQSLDYSSFNQVGEAFKKSSAYLEFQKRVEEDSEKIARFIRNNTPEWKSEFESDEWIDKPYEAILAELNITDPKQKKTGWA